MIAIFTIGIGALALLRRSKRDNQKRVYTIGILQTASHPALDAARDGFIQSIEKKMGDKVDFVVRNGQGSINNIHTIAQQFHAKDSINAIFAIATPAAQAIISVEKEKPIIAAAVSVAPEVADYFAQSNVCGVSDMIDVRKEVEAMKQLLPETIETIGILFCSAEVNSVAMSKVMSEELERAGYTPVLCSVASEADLQVAVHSALRKVDALLAPTDNVVANAIALIADSAAKAGKPLIVSDNLLVHHDGVLMARGVDYYESGKQAGEMAVHIMQGKKKPTDFSIVRAENKDVYVNEKMLDQLGYARPDVFSDDLKKEAAFFGWIFQ